MKIKLFVIIILVVFGAAAILYGVSSFRPQNTGYLFSPYSVPTRNIKEVARPKAFKIDKLGIDAFVEKVGYDSEGKMDIPKNYMNVGWFQPGFKPGEKGSAVIAGHLDTITGAPAVFYNIASLKKDDKITVVDEENKSFEFSVTDVRTFPYDGVPLDQVFGNSDRPKLNLITCSGIFDQATKNYSQRIVVYSQQVKQ